MDSALKPQGVFWLFSGITLLSSIFFIACMKETKNLTDKQKKDLYKFRFRDYEDIQFAEEDNEVILIEDRLKLK